MVRVQVPAPFLVRAEEVPAWGSPKESAKLPLPAPPRERVRAEPVVVWATAPVLEKVRVPAPSLLMVPPAFIVNRRSVLSPEPV